MPALYLPPARRGHPRSSRLRRDGGRMSRCPSCPREISRAKFEHEREGVDRQRGEGMKKPIMPYTAIYYQSSIGFHRTRLDPSAISSSFNDPAAIRLSSQRIPVIHQARPSQPIPNMPLHPPKTKDPHPDQTNSRHPLASCVAFPISPPPPSFPTWRFHGVNGFIFLP